MNSQASDKPHGLDGAQVAALDKAHVFHSWSAQGAITPLPVAGGAGSYFWDFDGKKYLDFLGGIATNVLGHAHPVIVRAVSKQIATLGHVSNLYSHPSGLALASKLQ